MSSVVDTLIEMGFSKEKAELAIKTTGSQNVQDAMDWLLSHEDGIEEQPQSITQQGEGVKSEVNASEEANKTEEDVESEAQAGPVAKSIKCDDCGKLFKNTDEVEFHAAKSGHENFSESTDEKKPLSEDEKKEQLAKIEAKLKQRRLEREAKEREESFLREKNRIKSGKELLEAKKKHEEIEMKKILEQRKREKEEERLAKQRVKEQIEQDKLARKAKFSGGSVEVSPPAQPVQPVVSKPSVSYDEVKLQIRLTDGNILTQTFGAKEPLSAVRVYVEMNRSDTPGPFNLMTTFPRKVFTSDDFDKPLDTLGLAPRANLTVLKS